MRAESSAGGLSPSREEGRPSQLKPPKSCGRRHTTWLRGGPDECQRLEGFNVLGGLATLAFRTARRRCFFHDALKALLGPNVDLPSTDGSEWPIAAPEAAERGGERSGQLG